MNFKKLLKNTFKILYNFIFGYEFVITNKRLKQEPIDVLSKIFINPMQDNMIEIALDNYKAPFYIRNHTTDVLLYKSIMVNIEYNFLVKKEPKIIIDAGANIGLASIFFANKFPNAKIIAIEPEDSNYKMLEINTKPYSNIHIIKAALWASVCELNLFSVGDNWCFIAETKNETHKIRMPRFAEHSLTKAVTVEYIMQKYCIDKIDILKIDIEGSEKEVFNNSSAWIDNVNSIIVELHEYIKKGCYKAFFKVAKKFNNISSSGENVYLSKNDYIEMYTH